MCRKKFAFGHDIHVVFPKLEGRAKVPCYGDAIHIPDFHTSGSVEDQVQTLRFNQSKAVTYAFGVDVSTKDKTNYPKWRHFNS